MDARSAGSGMPRRTFLAAAAAGFATLALASCTSPPAPTPSATPTPSPTPSPSPLPTVPGVPAPTAMARSRWGDDPWTLGGTAYDPVGGGDEARASLAASVEDRLWFAGDALPPEGTAPGTVVAARESGLAAAADVVRAAREGDRIAVVGAGIAGLSAATALAAAGFDVAVFEARRTVGGRAADRSAGGFDAPVRYGALLVPDDLGLLRELATANVRTTTFAPELLVRRTDGEPVAPSAFGVAALQTAHDWALAQPEDASMSAALAGSGATPVSPEPGPDGVSQADWLDYALRSGLAPATGATSAEASARSVDPTAIAAEFRTAKLPAEGLGGWIDDMSDAVDVAVGSAVSAIRIGTSRVSLRFDTGESFSADRVVVAVPLGVLRAGTIAFTPELPGSHRAAIDALPVGQLDVVWLRFDEAFWRPEAQEAETDEASGDEASGDETSPTPTPTDGSEDAGPVEVPQRLLTVVGGGGLGVAAWVDAADGDDAVLVGVLAAASATRLAALDDDEFLEAVLADLAPYGATPPADEAGGR